MTVAELIELLKSHPADMEVIVQSYEEGLDPVTDVKTMKISKRVDKPWYVGVYKEDLAGRATLLISSSYAREEMKDV